MKQLLAMTGVLVLYLAPVPGWAAALVDDAQITQRLCPMILCQSHWNEATLLICDGASTGHESVGKDYVFGTYIIGQTMCLCPCNFIKFYK
jgi:hypothetical protein